VFDIEYGGIMPAKPSLVVTVAVLASAAERPRHAYEIWSTMRLRSHDQLLGTSSTAVYDAVRRLARDGLLEVHGRDRDGGRPERTIYRATPGGLHVLQGGVTDLLEDLGDDLRRFQLGLTFMFVLPREQAIDLVSRRADRQEALIADVERQLAAASAPALFLAEHEYRLTLRRSELTWLRELGDLLVAEPTAWPGAGATAREPSDDTRARPEEDVLGRRPERASQEEES
jgi:DNA-binding PadR family transcriptional regulator